MFVVFVGFFLSNLSCRLGKCLFIGQVFTSAGGFSSHRGVPCGRWAKVSSLNGSSRPVGKAGEVKESSAAGATQKRFGLNSKTDFEVKCVVDPNIEVPPLDSNWMIFVGWYLGQQNIGAEKSQACGPKMSQLGVS